MATPARVQSELALRGAAADFCVASWRNVLLTNWRDKVRAEPLESTRSLSFELAARYPAGIVVYNVIEQGIPMPDTPVRKLASEILGQTGGHVLCTSTMIIGQGMWASMARAALATITLFARTPHPQKVFGDLLSAARWAAPNIAPEGTAPEDLATLGERIRNVVGV